MHKSLQWHCYGDNNTTDEFGALELAIPPLAVGLACHFRLVQSKFVSINPIHDSTLLVSAYNIILISIIVLKSPPGWWKPITVLFTPQPSGLEGIVTFWAGGRVGGRAAGCQNCGTHISVTTWRIFSVWSSVELSRHVTLSWSFAQLPHMGLPMGQKLVKFATNRVQTFRKAYLWNRWMDLPHLKFHGLV